MPVGQKSRNGFNVAICIFLIKITLNLLKHKYVRHDSMGGVTCHILRRACIEAENVLHSSPSIFFFETGSLFCFPLHMSS